MESRKWNTNGVQDAARGAQGRTRCPGRPEDEDRGTGAGCAVDDPLGHPCPMFLAQLDSDPDAAFAAFAEFSIRLFGAFPPATFRLLNREDREEMIDRIVYHCCREDFRVLRSYAVRPDIPFSRWLYRVGRNLACDLARRALRERGRVVPVLTEGEDQEEAMGIPIDSLVSADDSVEVVREHRDLLEKINDCLSGMEGFGRVVSEGILSGRSPKQIAESLRLPSGGNKKVSDHWRGCRAKIMRHLQGQGLAC